LLEPIDEGGYVSRIILKVTIECDDNWSSRIVEAGGHGCSLTKVLTETNDAYTRIGLMKRAHHRVTFVGTAVINEKDLIAPPIRLEGVGNLAIEDREVVLLIIDGNDN
jgi:hypothetical protein